MWQVGDGLPRADAVGLLGVDVEVGALGLPHGAASKAGRGEEGQRAERDASAVGRVRRDHELSPRLTLTPAGEGEVEAPAAKAGVVQPRVGGRAQRGDDIPPPWADDVLVDEGEVAFGGGEVRAGRRPRPTVHAVRVGASRDGAREVVQQVAAGVSRRDTGRVK